MPPDAPARYQDIYPSDALLRSKDVVRPRASELINLEFFEADPGEMPALRFAQHHVLINLHENMPGVLNRREGEGGEITLTYGDIVITPAGLESGWSWPAKSKVIIITIDPEPLERFAERELGQLLTDRQLKDVPHAHDEDLTQAAQLLLTALETRSGGSEIMYESLARVFTVKLLERYGEDAAEEAQFSRAFTPRHYKRVLDFLGERYGGSVAIADLASVAGLSEAHFSREFRKTIGDSPHQFLMRYRVEQAIKMIADEARSLGDIAHACGFSDQAHFTRLFKRFTGQTPRQYRAGQT